MSGDAAATLSTSKLPAFSTAIFQSHGPRQAACVTSPITDFGPYLALNASTNFLLFGLSSDWKYFIAA